MEEGRKKAWSGGVGSLRYVVAVKPGCRQLPLRKILFA
jgi:hypothetical protein